MSQPPYIQKIVPCECGSLEPYWHGPEDGAREYCCDGCWKRRERIRRIMRGQR
jgi:hypothetical protein